MSKILLAIVFLTSCGITNKPETNFAKLVVWDNKGKNDTVSFFYRPPLKLTVSGIEDENGNTKAFYVIAYKIIDTALNQTK